MSLAAEIVKVAEKEIKVTNASSRKRKKELDKEVDVRSPKKRRKSAPRK